MKAAIKHNRFLDSHLHSENEIVFGLDHCASLIKRYHGFPNNIDHALYPTIGFAAQVLSMMDLATPVEAERLGKRVAGAMHNPNDMRALRLELAVATHFVRRGYQLQWPEMVGGGTFDLLVTDLGKNGLEVECKSFSDDKGRNIHRSDVLHFHHLVFNELASIRKSLKIGLSVVLTIQDRLPTNHADRQALAKRVRQQITIGCSTKLECGSNLRISEFDPNLLKDIAGHNDGTKVRQVIQEVTGTNNRESILVPTPAGGALALVVQSAIEDNFVDAMFKTLSDAGKRQLSGSRPGLLIAGVNGLNIDQLISIAKQDNDGNQRPTALAIKVSSFLNTNHRNNVVGVGFLSRGALSSVTNGIYDSGGAAYYFSNQESSFWSTDFNGLFK
jgi:hypothetical protein